MPNRHGSDASPSDQYNYSFQNQEEDNEVYGSKGTFINYKYRGADTRIGRFFAIDPLAKDYPWNSPYAFSENSTIAYIELEGLERYYAADGTFLGKVGNNDKIRIVKADHLEEAKMNIRKIKMGKDLNGGNSKALYQYRSTRYILSSDEAVSAVGASIYKKVKSSYKLKEMKVEYKDNGTGAHTEEKGVFAIYKFANHNSEFLNENYYNQLNILYHEEQHNISFATGGDGAGDIWSHFDIQMKATKHWSYKNTTSNYKDYSRAVSAGYLQAQGKYFSRLLANADNGSEIIKSKDFKYSYGLYKKNVALHNKTYKANFKAVDASKIVDLKPKSK